MLTSYKYSQVAFRDDAKDKLMAGVDLVCDVTSTTLGPRGNNVAIDKGYAITVLHDGVSAATSVKPKDPYTALGAKIVQEAAKKQRDAVGDGTTAVMVLTQSILKEAHKSAAAGVNTMSMRREIEEAAKKVVAEIENHSQPVKTLEQKIQVSTISAEDHDLGRLIAETVHKVGDQGIITVEESKAAETVVEVQEGMQIDKGYAHRLMMTEPERELAILEDAHILITDIPLMNMAEIASFLNEKVVPQKINKVLFISPEIGGDFLGVLIQSKMEGRFLGVAVRAPGVGSHQLDMLQDICALTGAKFISKDAGMNFEELDHTVLGHANKITVSKTTTIITEGAGLKEDVTRRIAAIKKQGEDPGLSEWDKQKLRERYGKLTNGIAVVKVGGETEVEMNERKERAIDAVAATQAAVHYGIVPGGEIVYLNAAKVIENETTLGAKILYNALHRPFAKLLENGGFNSGEKLAEWKMQKPGYGFDVTDGTFKDMAKNGIIDPTLVPTSAIKTAVSVAIQILTTGAAIVPDDDPVPPVSKT